MTLNYYILDEKKIKIIIVILGVSILMDVFWLFLY